MKPDKKILAKALEQNARLKANTKYRENRPTFKDRQATPSAKIMKDLMNEVMER